MPMIINRIVIEKKNKHEGTASVNISSGEDNFTINNFIINLNSGREPIAVMRHEGKAMLAGNFIEFLTDVMLDLFLYDLCDDSPGLYEFRKGTKKKIN